MNTQISLANTIVYLNGSTDYVSANVQINSNAGTPVTLGANPDLQNFMGHLITGQSSGGGDSVWTEEDGKAVYKRADSRVKILDTVSSDSLDLISNSAGTFIDSTGDGKFRINQQISTQPIEFYANGTEAMKIDSSNNVSVAKDLIVANDGYGISWGRSNGSPRIYADEDGDLNIRHGEGSVAMTIGSNGQVYIDKNLTFPNVPTGHTASPNTYLDVNGTICKTSWAGYSAE